MIRRTMVILYLPQQTNTCSKTATKTLEITDDNSNENLFKKQPPDAFYKKDVLILQNSQQKPVPESLFQ